MNIAYVAGYQSEFLIEKRNLKRNRALAASKKIGMIAEALAVKNHKVQIFSTGPVRENSLIFYPKFTQLIKNTIKVHFASALDMPFFSIIWSIFSLLFVFREECRKEKFNAIIIYNVGLPEITCAYYALLRYKTPIVLEYEDSAVVNRMGKKSIKTFIWMNYAKKLLNNLSACIAPSPYLLESINCQYKLLVRGIFENNVFTKAKENKKKQIVFAGTLSKSKGILELLDAWSLVNIPDWTLHIAGTGPLKEIVALKVSSMNNAVYHGFIAEEDLVSLLTTSAICINPHKVSENPGNVFAFKIIEYIAAGAHIITTPMGAVEKEIENYITYIESYSVTSIAETIEMVINKKMYTKINPEYVYNQYSLEAVASRLNEMLEKIKN